jgi:hypothetical protein
MRPPLIITVQLRMSMLTGVTTAPKSIQRQLTSIAPRPTSTPAEPTKPRSDKSRYRPQREITEFALRVKPGGQHLAAAIPFAAEAKVYSHDHSCLAT